MPRREQTIVGLDVGTTKVCAVVGEPSTNGSLEIIGVGLAESDGQRKGIVVDVDTTVASIKAAVEEAELMAGTSVDRAFVGVAGGHIRGFNSRGSIDVNGRTREITEEDIRRVIDAARSLELPPDRELLHLLPQEFVIDDHSGILDPLGMSGSRLEVNVHLVVGALSAVQTLVTCVNRAGIEAQAVVLEQLASNEAVLTEDERQLGVALVDMGGGTTDIACILEGSVCHTAVLPAGGDHFTNDIAVGLNTPIADAERIKVRYGCVSAALVDPDQALDVPGIGGRGSRLLPRRRLCEILEPRAAELLDLVHEEIARAGYFDQLNAGLVLTGGGALLEGFADLAEQQCGMPVRIGMPQSVDGLVDIVSSPIYSTAVGLALYGHYNRDVGTYFEPKDSAWVSRVVGRLSHWLGELF
ncbi:MAG: cell division protein FtsA [Acidobacteriota bacterium]